MGVGYVSKRKYTSVTLLFQNKEQDGEGRALDASSGIYVFDGDDTQDGGNYIVSVVEEKIVLDNVVVRYTCAELINDTKVRWINIPVEGIKVEELVSEDLEGFFEMCKYEGPRHRYVVVCRLPSFCAIRNELKPFEIVRGQGQSQIRGQLPRQIRIESSPFGLTTVDIFNGYTSYGYVNYESKSSDFWLSDCRYMENMNGGVVMLGEEDGLSTRTNGCIGLVWGNIKWPGHGELMIIVGWDRLLAQSGLFTAGRQGAPIASPIAANAVHRKVVGLQVRDKHGVLSWGSGVVVDRGTIATNKHVITGSCTSNDLPESIEIMHAGGVARVNTPKLDRDVYMSLESHDHDVCFLRCQDALFCTTIAGIEVFGGGLLRTFAERRSNTNAIGEVGSLRVGDQTISIGYGLFLHHGRPLQSAGHVTKIHGACETVISSSSCWSGCSGGALVNSNGQLVALMASNIRHLASGEVLEHVNMAIGVPLLSVCHTKLVASRQNERRARSPILPRARL